MTQNELVEPVVNVELALKLGLTSEEYGKILEILKRIPTYTELGVFSVMWSEHCSYKNSIKEIKKLPTKGKNMLVNAGEENAGLINIGNNLAVAFKIESHNHPSAIEPYQGAATGVGGILRDIFTMGARPVAALNSLRFGNLDNIKTKQILKGVVKGIGDYGNCFGVPTVGGEVYFHSCYDDNPLVNAMAVGIVTHDKIAKSKINGVGRSVMITGSTTGKDGIQGASFASEDLTEKSEEKRPSVQVGDPFTEKLLLEATLEVIQEDLIDSIQDMGAAGLTCSTSEMSAKGDVGIEINLDLVPQREKNMTPFEIMLSESQERMLIVAKPGCEKRINEIFEKWDLHCVTIGKSTDTKNLIVYFKGNKVVDVPSYWLALGGGAPVYEREKKVPSYFLQNKNQKPQEFDEPTNYSEIIKKILGNVTISSKKWITNQYDSMVRTSTIKNENIDAAIVKLVDSDKLLAFSTDCNSNYVYLNPKIGAMMAVAESARNILCVGGKPIGITNCLNFGNPYNSEVFWQFSESIEGIAEACRSLNIPVTGGNVSFYNQSQNNAIYPTPVIGMVGLIDSIEDLLTNKFQSSGDSIYLIGSLTDDINGTVYLKLMTNSEGNNAPKFDMKDELALHNAINELNKSKLITSIHDITEGGIFVTLAEMSFNKKNLGCEIAINSDLRFDKLLFSECQSRVIVTINKEKEIEFEKILNSNNHAFIKLGKVLPEIFKIGEVANTKISELEHTYFTSLQDKVN